VQGLYGVLDIGGGDGEGAAGGGGGYLLCWGSAEEPRFRFQVGRCKLCCVFKRLVCTQGDSPASWWLSHTPRYACALAYAGSVVSGLSRLHGDSQLDVEEGSVNLDGPPTLHASWAYRGPSDADAAAASETSGSTLFTTRYSGAGMGASVMSSCGRRSALRRCSGGASSLGRPSSSQRVRFSMETCGGLGDTPEKVR
jgi:hypothetical protein